MNELGLYLSICGAIFLGLSVVKVCNQTLTTENGLTGLTQVNPVNP